MLPTASSPTLPTSRFVRPWFHWLWLVGWAMLGWACENRYLKGEQLPPLPQANANSLTKRLDFMNEVIGKHPNEADYFFRRGVIYAEINKDNLALEDIGRAIGLDSGNQEYFYMQAKWLDLAGKPAEAFQSANRAERLGYASPEFTWLLGRLCFLNNAHPRAEAYLNESRTHLGERADTFYYLGIIKKQASDTLNATAFLEQAIALKPAYPEAFKAMVDMYARVGAPKKAARYAYRAVTNCPNDGELCEIYAQCLENLDENSEAIFWYEKAVKLAPRLWRANYQLAMYHYRKEHFARAARHLQVALETKPELPQGFATLAWINFKYLDNNQDALKYYELALKSTPNDVEISAMLERTKKRIAFEEYKKTPEGQAYMRRKREEAQQAAADSTAN
jgi:tetratricopeptide (TPR) repeat protein